MDSTPADDATSPRPDGVRAAPLQPQEAFAQLGAIVLGEPLGRVLHRVTDLAVACIPGADEVSVTLLEGDRPTTAAFSGRLAAALDERQYELGFGPCLDAAQTGQTLRIDDTSHDESYPDFAATAARQGVRSTLSIGLPMPQRVLGALNVYRFGETPLDAEAEQLATTFAGYAGVALANAALFASTADLAGQLQKAMQTRAVIEQAKGILMARLRCTAEDAFAHLSKQSQDNNRKLREVALELVTRTVGGG